MRCWLCLALTQKLSDLNRGVFSSYEDMNENREYEFGIWQDVYTSSNVKFDCKNPFRKPCDLFVYIMHRQVWPKRLLLFARKQHSHIITTAKWKNMCSRVYERGRIQTDEKCETDHYVTVCVILLSPSAPVCFASSNPFSLVCSAKSERTCTVDTQTDTAQARPCLYVCAMPYLGWHTTQHSIKWALNHPSCPWNRISSTKKDNRLTQMTINQSLCFM